MNTDLLISVLVQSNWLFFAGWIMLLATAFAMTFPEKTFPEKRLLTWRSKSRSVSSRPHP